MLKVSMTPIAPEVATSIEKIAAGEMNATGRSE
jgi:hypothetical protein